MPLYLFSGTFFAVEQLPPGCSGSRTPLRCGTASTCAARLSLGTATWPGSLGHVPYLVALAVVACFFARRTYRRHLHA